LLLLFLHGFAVLRWPEISRPEILANSAARAELRRTASSGRCKMDPVKAAETIGNISDDLDWGNIPTDRIGYSVWKEARNREKAPRSRKR